MKNIFLYGFLFLHLLYTQSIHANAILGSNVLVNKTGNQHEILVEINKNGNISKLSLKKTPVQPSAISSGWGPKRKAGFVSWKEGKDTWSAYSRNEGATWSKSRRIQTSLALRDGETFPGMAMPNLAPGLGLSAKGQLYIVQFKTISLPEWRDALQTVGAKIKGYLPHNAHIVRMPANVAAAIQGMEFVERVEPLQASYKLEKSLRGWLKGAKDDRETKDGKLRLRVLTFKSGKEGKMNIAPIVGLKQSELTGQWIDKSHLVEVEINRVQLRKLALHDDVMWIDRWGPPETDMDIVRRDSGAQWIMDNTLGYCGEGVRGEVFDNGFDPNHVDFGGEVLIHPTGALLTDPNATISKCSPGATSFLYCEHGTSSYGAIFAKGDNQAKGLLPCGQGIFAQTESDEGLFGGSKYNHTAQLKEAPYYASFQTSSVSRSGTGLVGTDYTSVSYDIDDIIWKLDIAFTQSQGNNGLLSSPEFGIYPWSGRDAAWAKNIISVGGITHYNSEDIIDEKIIAKGNTDDKWDCYLDIECNSAGSIGPAKDGRIKPDIHHWRDGIYTTSAFNGYIEATGTSIATPVSAGIMGLMIEMWSKNVWNTNPQGNSVFERQPHFSTIKALVINNARQYDFVGQDDDKTRVHQGWGRPNVQIAYERAQKSFIVDADTPLQLGQKAVYDVSVKPGEEELKITMIYPDPPGIPLGSVTYINDLNLKVTSPPYYNNGQVVQDIYYGNFGLNDGPYSVSGGAPNRGFLQPQNCQLDAGAHHVTCSARQEAEVVDTVENVFIQNPVAGEWRVEVEAAGITKDAYITSPSGNEPADAVFSLVVTGGVNQVFPNDPNFTSLDYLHNIGSNGGTPDADIDAPEAWAMQTGRHDVVVAVTDSGVDYLGTTLGDFGFVDADQNGLPEAGNIWGNVDDPIIPGVTDEVLADDDNNTYPDDTVGWDFENDKNTPLPPAVFTIQGYHGTVVANIIGAVGNNGLASAGISWDVQLMLLTMWGHVDRLSAASEAILYASQNGADIINASWGENNFYAGSQSVHDSIRIAADNQILFVAAAGNLGSEDNVGNIVGQADMDNDAKPVFPGSYVIPNIINVTATDNNDLLVERFGKYTVDLAAPGGLTSWSTPLVSGSIALLLSQEKDRIDANPGYRKMTVGEIKYLLLTSVDKLPGLDGKVVSGGRLNAHKLLLNYTDSDLDGYANRIERLFGTDPTSTSEKPDLTADSDNDGLSNADELAYGTVPYIPAGEILSELIYPIYLDGTGNLTSGFTSTDSDGDGVSDYDEVTNLVSGPYTQNITDPANPDTDGDGVMDQQDIFPNDPMEWSDIDNDGIGDNSDPDIDGDSVLNTEDNCTLVANTDQRDTNQDGYGNMCDGDLNDDEAVNIFDLGLFKQRFGTTDADADFDGDGAVNIFDLGLFKQMFGKPPGPSAFGQ